MLDIDLKSGSIPLKRDLHRALKVKRFCREKSSPTPLPLLVGDLNTTSPSFSSGWPATLIRVKAHFGVEITIYYRLKFSGKYFTPCTISVSLDKIKKIIFSFGHTNDFFHISWRL